MDQNVKILGFGGVLAVRQAADHASKHGTRERAPDGGASTHATCNTSLRLLRLLRLRRLLRQKSSESRVTAKALPRHLSAGSAAARRRPLSLTDVNS